MSGKIKRLFGFEGGQSDPEPLGEDMAPSPYALAERTALSGDTADAPASDSSSPFVNTMQAPLRDFTG